jgi:iron complex outermembrane receptor protein
VHRFHLLASATLLSALSTGVTCAQVSETIAGVQTGQIDEIVVTAQKRTESIQDVPLSIQAVTGLSLENAGVENPIGLGKVVQTLQITNTLFGSGVTIRIRGFGSPANTATDSDVASYVDSAYIPRPGAILSSFLDLKNVEVLSGPQGTLFGRNAAMGAISLNTNAPTTNKTTLESKLEGANYGTFSGTGIANPAINENFALRFAVNGSHTDGIYHNNLDGRTYGASDAVVGRVSSKWDIADNLSWILRVDGANTHGDGAYPGAVYTDTASSAQLTALTGFVTRFGGTPPVYSNVPSYDFNQLFKEPYESDKQAGITSDLSWNLTPLLTARLIDSYRGWNNKQLAGDTVATSLDLLSVFAHSTSKAQSHELQFLSAKNAFLGNRLGFTSGLYYFHEDYTLDTGFNLGSQFCPVLYSRAPPLIPFCKAGPQTTAGFISFDQGTDSYAGYLQASFEVAPTLELDAGVRETWDRKSGTYSQATANPTAIRVLLVPEGPEALRFTDNRPSVRASLSWHVTEQIMPFFTYATGYKSGGFNSGSASPALNAAVRTFESETADDYELGVKSILWNGKIQMNATLFNTKLKNFQDRSFNGTGFVIRNSGDVRSRGLDLDGQFAALSDLKLTYGVTYLNSIYTNNPTAPGLEGCTGGQGCPITQNLTGQPLGYAPRWHANVALQWNSTPFLGGYTAVFAPRESYTSSYLTSNTDNPQSRVPGYATSDLRFSVYSPSERWHVDLYGENVFDKQYYVTTIAQVLGAAMRINSPVTGATVYRGFLGDPVRYGVRVAAKF